MTEQLHFIVERTPIGFQPATVDRLPDKYQGKRAKLNGLVYHLRIDDRPDLPWEPQRLFALWQEHRGKLPPAPEVVVEVLKHCDDCRTPEKCAATRECLGPGPKAYWLPPASMATLDYYVLPDHIPAFGVMPGDPDRPPANWNPHPSPIWPAPPVPLTTLKHVFGEGAARCCSTFRGR